MSFGITPEGFNLKRLSDILSDIEEKERSFFGTIDVSGDSVFGQLNGTFANQCSDLWEQTQKAYNASSPALASDITLDYNVLLNGIERLQSLPTLVEVGLHGTNGTIVTAGTQISSTVDGEVYQLRGDTTITLTSQSKVFVKVDTVVDSTVYTITINGTDVYQYTSSSSATADEIAQGLRDDIAGDSGAVVTATKYINGVIEIVGNSAPFDIAYDSNLIHYSIGEFESVNNGEILAIANTLTVIETPLTGLDDVNNFDDGTKGRGIETDPELRLRREESLQIIGAATLPAMIARMLNEVDEVVTVAGYTNRENITVAGRPPHSVEMVVQGGDDQDILDKLWEIIGGGIDTYGNTSGTIVDSNGDVQTLYFSRPVPKYAWMIATLTLYSEETFPTDGATQVKNQILEYGESLGIGKDIIPDRFKGPIYEVPGILGITLQVAITTLPTDTPSYVSTPISIDADELSIWELSRIVVNVV